jgi:hypothetical protein
MIRFTDLAVNEGAGVCAIAVVAPNTVANTAVKTLTGAAKRAVGKLCLLIVNPPRRAVTLANILLTKPCRRENLTCR